MFAGLHAAGTDMAGVMGGFYRSGGINLRLAMTFGYVAGRFPADVLMPWRFPCKVETPRSTEAHRPSTMINGR